VRAVDALINVGKRQLLDQISQQFPSVGTAILRALAGSAWQQRDILQRRVCPRGTRQHTVSLAAAPRQANRPALTPLVTLTRARGPGRGLPVATGSLAHEMVAPKQHQVSGVFSLWRVGAEQSGAAS
jgi:hypothetical protein